VDKLIQTIDYQVEEILDIPDCNHVVNEQEEEVEMQPVSSCPTYEEAFRALSLLESVIVDDRTVKGMDVIQEFVSNIYANSLDVKSS
jgi:hypothetical protein